MKIIAKSPKGKEYLYSRRDCYRVSNRAAEDIAAELNRSKYNIKENEVWSVHEYDAHTREFTNAGWYKIYKYKNNIKIKYCEDI